MKQRDLFMETVVESLGGMTVDQILSMDGVVDTIIKNMTIAQKKEIVDIIKQSR